MTAWVEQHVDFLMLFVCDKDFARRFWGFPRFQLRTDGVSSASGHLSKPKSETRRAFLSLVRTPNIRAGLATNILSFFLRLPWACHGAFEIPGFHTTIVAFFRQAQRSSPLHVYVSGPQNMKRTTWCRLQTHVFLNQLVGLFGLS